MPLPICTQNQKCVSLFVPKLNIGAKIFGCVTSTDLQSNTTVDGVGH